ncbi:ParB/RepB/Spo0J family partition protein [Butyrivibrio sp. AE2032]|uniref:ParB/RepB/Spo0J family partition protein n=1 Tax=Butyrivibrio sp. AE2032 TaxID=1458463 RepID=UPI0005509372|nr:ParB/RepB/Spo0J family partition protein [Butyrivibrio sp. AE2032]
MREKPKLDLGLTAYDDLFKNEQELAESKLPKIYDIPIELIDDFPDHPFKVKLDEDMDQLVESIKERGLITPITLRPKEDGRYEIVSGHRRKKACEIAGLSYVKADVREMGRDEAIILMVESNLQRSVILPSEKAFSYKMRLEAMNRLPGRPSGNLTPVVSEKMRTNEELGKEVGESREQIRRYIRLTELIPDLLDLVDEGKIALRPAVELSYLSKNEQQMVFKQIEICECTPSHAQTIRMRKISQNGGLNSAMIEDIMLEEKPNQREKVSVSYDKVRKFIPESIPFEETGSYIMDALEFYQKYRSKVSQINNKNKLR